MKAGAWRGKRRGQSQGDRNRHSAARGGSLEKLDARAV